MGALAHASTGWEGLPAYLEGSEGGLPYLTIAAPGLSPCVMKGAFKTNFVLKAPFMTPEPGWQSSRKPIRYLTPGSQVTSRGLAGLRLEFA